MFENPFLQNFFHVRAEGPPPWNPVPPLNQINTHCAWAGGTAELSRIINQICWLCAFSLTYHVCFRIFDQFCWAFFSLLKLIVAGLDNLRCQYQEVSDVALIVGINRFSAD